MRTVLIVEPDRASRRQLVALIEHRGLEADAIATLEEATAYIEQNPVDMAIIAVDLPDGSGIDLLRLLSPDNCLQCVLLSDDPSVSQLLERTGAKNVQCLTRPVEDAAIHPILTATRHRKTEARRAGKVKTNGGKRNNVVTGPMLGECPAMLDVYEMIARVAPTDASVLICGESGTGKEVVARAIHDRSDRTDGRFIAVNCGAIPTNLIESELFGHEKGAFTGADKQRDGVFEQAHEGTLFLDEITEMPVEMQVRLLRALETQSIRRVGGDKDIAVDVRVIAATNQDTTQAVNDGAFREDLLYRIAVFPIALPPLRKRGDDVIMLAEHFLDRFNEDSETSKTLADLGKKRIRQYHWPGNVRQLKNMVHRAYIMEDGTVELESLQELLDDEPIDTCGAPPDHHGIGEHADGAVCGVEDDDQPSSDKATSARSPKSVDPATPTSKSDGPDDPHVVITVGHTIGEAERMLILSTLEEYDGDKKKAAEVLGISLKTLYNRLNEYEEEDVAG